MKYMVAEEMASGPLPAHAREERRRRPPEGFGRQQYVTAGCVASSKFPIFDDIELSHCLQMIQAGLGPRSPVRGNSVVRAQRDEVERHRGDDNAGL
jgi:hypothetical protein